MISVSPFHMVLRYNCMNVVWICLELLKKQQEKEQYFFFFSVWSVNDGKDDVLKYKKCY